MADQASQDHRAIVAERFSRLPHPWKHGLDAAIVGAAWEAHGSAGRFYHAWSHVEACLATLATFPCLHPRRVFLALIFHDAVYETGRPDNEERSARLAEQVLSAHPGIPAEEMAWVVAAIRSTASHVPPPGSDEDVRAVLDIDMSVLGASPDEYDRYSANIEREWVPSATTAPKFAIGRLSFLRRLLGPRPIYATEEGRRRWEASARANVAREIDRLKTRVGVVGRFLARLR